MRIFITGGCKNGKSSCAQRIAFKQKTHLNPLYYIATMTASDDEDRKRIERHRKEREGLGFITIEQPNGIENILEQRDHRGSFLLDSLTALLANEMFSASGSFDENAHERIAAGMLKILSCIQNIVIVSDYIYSGALIYDMFTEAYRKTLAALDKLAAKNCDAVLEAAYTQIIAHKGGDLLKNAFDGVLCEIH